MMYISENRGFLSIKRSSVCVRYAISLGDYGIPLVLEITNMYVGKILFICAK